MKKIFASFAFIMAFAAYGLYQYFGRSGTVSYVSSGTTPIAQPIDTQPIAQSAPPLPPPPPKPRGQYIDGSYTGSIADAYYGNVQVRATVSGGKITDVAFLQYPNDRNTSRYINSQAMPILKSEAIQTQNAQVNGVSGASDTSGAFRESLATALTQAKS